MTADEADNILAGPISIGTRVLMLAGSFSGKYGTIVDMNTISWVKIQLDDSAPFWTHQIWKVA